MKVQNKMAREIADAVKLQNRYFGEIQVILVYGTNSNCKEIPEPINTNEIVYKVQLSARGLTKLNWLVPSSFKGLNNLFGNS
jgi:hypothetical protein